MVGRVHGNLKPPSTSTWTGKVYEAHHNAAVHYYDVGNELMEHDDFQAAVRSGSDCTVERCFALDHYAEQRSFLHQPNGS